MVSRQGQKTWGQGQGQGKELVIFTLEWKRKSTFRSTFRNIYFLKLKICNSKKVVMSNYYREDVVGVVTRKVSFPYVV